MTRKKVKSKFLKNKKSKAKLGPLAFGSLVILIFVGCLILGVLMAIGLRKIAVDFPGRWWVDIIGILIVVPAAIIYMMDFVLIVAGCYDSHAIMKNKSRKFLFVPFIIGVVLLIGVLILKGMIH